MPEWEECWEEWVSKIKQQRTVTLKACLSHDLLMSNIVYRLPNCNTATLQALVSNRFCYRQQKRDRLCSADYWIDWTHHLKTQHAYPAQATPTGEND